MRIAIVNTSYPPHVIGGAERSVAELARGLASDGHTVRVFVLGPKDDGLTSESDGGVTVVRIGSRAFRPFAAGGKHSSARDKLIWHVGELARFTEFRSLRSELRRFAPDVVHTNNLAGFGWLGWRAAKGIPLVHTMRDYYLSCMASTHWRNGRPCSPNSLACRISKFPLRHAINRPDVFVGVSRDIVDRHKAYGSVRAAERATTIYNSPMLPPHVERKVAAETPFTFGMLGRIGSDKGTWVAIEAFFRLASRMDRRVVLKVAGSGVEAEIEQLRTLAAGRDDVEYVGVADPAEFYATVNCALVPTQWPEPFGRTAAEAIVAGTTLVASRTGGLPEVVELYGGSAILVDDYHSAKAWATSMADAVGRPLLPVDDVSRPREDVHRRYLVEYQVALGIHRQHPRGVSA